MTGESTIDEVGGVFEALADPTRRRVLDLLARDGEATASSLAEQLPVSRQAVVKHLAVLESAGLAVSRRAGREVRFVAQPARLEAAAAWMVRRAVHWQRRLEAVKRMAES